ncbi:MAG TPA: phosphatase PAP2 family protein [Acidimicrobiales bacterium]|nr:phosphatase PAP2 family protein [Acidimicrobiales bacterium]
MLYGVIAVIVAVATTRWWARVVMWTLAVTLTVAVALSRVYRGEHYPMDVIAGFLVAAVFIIRVAGVNRTERSNASEGSTLVTQVTSTDDAAQ